MRTKRFIIAVLALLLSCSLTSCSQKTAYAETTELLEKSGISETMLMKKSSVEEVEEDFFENITCENHQGNIGKNCLFSRNGKSIQYDYVFIRKLVVEDINTYNDNIKLLSARKTETDWEISNIRNNTNLKISNSTNAWGTTTFVVNGYPISVTEGSVIIFAFEVISDNGNLFERLYMYSPDINEFVWCEKNPCPVPYTSVKVTMIGEIVYVDYTWDTGSIPNSSVLEVIVVNQKNYYLQ